MLPDFSLSRAGQPIPFLCGEKSPGLEKLLTLWFDSSSVGFSIVDSDLRFIAINDELANMNGLPVADHMGKTVREILGDAAASIEAQFRHVLSTGAPVLDFHVSALLPRRQEVGHWIENFFPIPDESGAVKRAGAVVVEVGQQERLRAEVGELSQKLKNYTDRIQMLNDIGSILSSNWNVRKVFPTISARIRRVLRHEYASFYVHDSGSGLLVRQSYDFPLSKGLIWDVPISADNSPSGRSLQQRAALIYSREQLETFDAEVAKRVLKEGLHTLCCVPVVRPTGALGVLVLGSTRNDAFQPDDLSLLNQVAIQLGIALENHRAAAEIASLKHRLAEERAYLQGEIPSRGQFSEIIGESPALKQVLDQVATVAPSNATVLILGETGTGKELIARAIHKMSRRSESAFVKLNCAAIPTGLLESELFGHEKGAFTGAVSQKIGRLEVADGGTLFLDEVGEIPLELQPKLLRVLQDQEFERLGSTRTIRVKVRLVAATNRDLARSVAEHEFRSDLFYRLNVFPIHIPPLRERAEDIPLLVRHFVRKFARSMDRPIETIPKATMAALRRWSWPGNVRELENLMERSVILSSGPALHVPACEQPGDAAGVSLLDDSLNTAEREHILRVLSETRGVISGRHGAAHRLGLKRTTLQSKMQRLGIRHQDYLGRR